MADDRARGAEPDWCRRCGMPHPAIRPTPDRGGELLCPACWARSLPLGPFDRGRGRLREGDRP